MNRHIATTRDQRSVSDEEWVQQLLDKTASVPFGYQFTWNDVSNTAYLYEAAMRYVRIGQDALLRSESMIGKQAYLSAVKGAKSFAFVLHDILPKWTFRPHLLTETTAHDIYGHYCLARAMAYDTIGTGDMTCSDYAKVVACANAAHLYAVAAHLIDGDVVSIVKRAEHATGKTLVLRAQQFLEAWQKDDDELGAASAVACLTEASERFARAKQGCCDDLLQFAIERNQVHWQEPKLPEWSTLMRVQISAL